MVHDRRGGNGRATSPGGAGMSTDGDGGDDDGDVPAVRIWPMSDRIDGFRDRSIEDVQRRLFLGTLAGRRGGRFRYRSSGLSAPAGTIVLFQFRARIVASAAFVRDERFERPGAGGERGALRFEPGSVRTFEPLDVEAMREVWPRFRGFGHVKQALNPAMYPAFVRRLRNVAKRPG